MQLSTTFRHMEASPAVKDYAEERLEKIKKYFSRDPIAAHGKTLRREVDRLRIVQTDGVVRRRKQWRA